VDNDDDNDDAGDDEWPWCFDVRSWWIALPSLFPAMAFFGVVSLD